MHRTRLLPPPFSSCAGGTPAVGLVHQLGNPAGHVPGGIVKDGTAGFGGNSPNMFSERKWL
jgi:hypothetical protein